MELEEALVAFLYGVVNILRLYTVA